MKFSQMDSDSENGEKLIDGKVTVDSSKNLVFAV